MVTYQTALYKVKYLDKQFGWDYNELIFESRIHEDPWKAMMEFDLHDPSHTNCYRIPFLITMLAVGYVCVL